MFDLEIVAHVKTSRKWFTLTVKFGRNSDECTSSAAFSQSATGSYKTIIILIMINADGSSPESAPALDI